MQPTTLLVLTLLGAGALKLPSPGVLQYSRRTAVTGGLAAALLPTACRGEEPPAVAEPALAPAAADEATPAAPAPVPPAPPPPTTITYDALSQRLADCQSGSSCTVEKVEFSSSSGDAGAAIVGGQRLEVLGIPAENPNSTNGPLKLAARCRDAGVPYTFPFTEFLKKQNAVKQEQAAASAASGGGGLSLPKLPSLPTLPSLPKLF